MYLFHHLYILLQIIFSTLDEAKLKEKGRAFHDMFLTKVLMSQIQFSCQYPIMLYWVNFFYWWILELLTREGLFNLVV